jgi:hypothetical protein
LKRKIYWIDENETEDRMQVDELIIADGPNSSGFFKRYILDFSLKIFIQLF